jgi:hypothetical protein
MQAAGRTRKSAPPGRSNAAQRSSITPRRRGSPTKFRTRLSTRASKASVESLGSGGKSKKSARRTLGCCGLRSIACHHLFVSALFRTYDTHAIKEAAHCRCLPWHQQCRRAETSGLAGRPHLAGAGAPASAKAAAPCSAAHFSPIHPN